MATQSNQSEIANALRVGERHLSRRDPFLRGVIRRNGPCALRPHRGYYEILVRAIISQQLSGKAAETIINRFRAVYGPNGFPRPDRILATPDAVLRATGMSNGKVTFVKDLAARLQDGSLKLNRLSRMGDDEIVAMLTEVKGIGVWTAHMFLMFSLCRLDVLPVGDLGIRNAFQRHYGLSGTPTAAQMESVAERNGWRPYRTIASWYLWRALEDESLKTK
ncbi:MAG: DNA-3-methyladenine glycosylase 2 family protein [Candidatus Hydrogenedentes bacterium]|nr:DNA-3-methyladenine glycosylase 2 family protein [Candidatus Hydrogenedentota bacterium]